MNPRRLLAAVLLVALAALLATLHSTAFASTNFTVEAIEITQAQQIEPRGEIQGVTDCGSEFDPVEPLIARRRTGSRVLVTRSDGPIPVVKGT